MIIAFAVGVLILFASVFILIVYLHSKQSARIKDTNTQAMNNKDKITLAHGQIGAVQQTLHLVQSQFATIITSLTKLSEGQARTQATIVEMHRKKNKNE